MKSILLVLLVLFPLAARAAGPAAPGAGSILKQINPVIPPAPSSGSTGLTIEQGGVTEPSASKPFEVKSIQITGNTLFDTGTLHTLVMNAEGRNLTLSKLDELAARITDYYHSHGYPLARAIIPAQTIEAGIVHIEIIEARYGRINLENHSRVNDALLKSALSPVQSGQAIEQNLLDHSLLILSDIPGIVPSATLKPGDVTGAADLTVETAPGQRASGSVSLDNYGNTYTGRTHLGGATSFINPLHHGDVLSVNGLSSGSEMNYGHISYESLLNGQGTRMGGSYSTLHYILGSNTFTPLNGHGTAQVESLWVKNPLARSRDINLYGQLQYDQKKLRDHIDTTSIRTDRHLDNWTVSLSGDRRDTFLSGGIDSWNVGLTSGRVGFDDTTAQLTDATTTNTQGHFSKWTTNLVRLQNLSQKNSLYLAFSGQWSNTNLDASEQMIAGGPYSVRAYDMGAVSGDDGYLGTAEFRHDMEKGGLGQFQAIGFIDSEHVTVNKIRTAGTNDATLSGAGMGFNWIGPDQWNARIYAAKRIGSTPSLVGSAASARAWVEINKGF